MGDGLNAAEIEIVWKKARETNVAQIVHQQGDPAHIRRIFKPGGAVEKLVLEPEPRHLKVFRVEDLIAQANKPFDAAMDKDQNKRLIIVGGNSVCLMLNTDNCREFVVLGLALSDEYNFFYGRTIKPDIEIGEFRTALRYCLRSTFADAKLIDQIGNISFGGTSNNQQAASRTTESLGKTITAEAQSDAEAGLPDDRITFSVRMWDNDDLTARCPIECQLDPDPQSQRWIVYPIRESFHHFHAQNLGALTQRISTEVKDVQIVQGSLDT